MPLENFFWKPCWQEGKSNILSSIVWIPVQLFSQVILNCNALPSLLHLLSSSKESIRKEACWTISNITAGNRTQIQVQYMYYVDSLLSECPIIVRELCENFPGGDWCQHSSNAGGNPKQVRIQDKERSSMGDNQCDIRGNCATDQVGSPGVSPFHGVVRV